MSDRRLLPYKFASAGRHAVVLLIAPERLDWRAGFFDLALPRDRPADAIVPYAEWRARAERGSCADYRATGAIFHVSRCGSTLLAQNLRACGALVLGEPPFMRILRERLGGTIAHIEAVRAATLVIGQWQGYARERDQKLVVKFNSQLHAYVTELMAALPGARFAFLHREPLPVLESLGRRPPAFLVREARLASKGDHPSDGFGGGLGALDENPLLLAAARRYLDALEAFGTLDDPRLLAVGYGELAARFPQIADHLLGRGTTWPEWRPEMNAKAENPATVTRYRPIAPEVLATFRRAHRPLLDHVEMRHRDHAARHALRR